MRKLFFAALVVASGIVFASQNSTTLPTTGTVTGLQMTQKINDALDTVATMESGSSNPGSIGPYRLWVDTGNSLLKQRNAANTGWDTIAPLLTQLAPINSPGFTGVPTAPTAAGGTNSTQIATTAFVNAATVAKASTLSQSGGSGSAMTFNWSGQSGQPTWLWGGNDGVNHYVYNPSNFSVNYANSAGSASSATTASNANALGGIAASGFLRNLQTSDGSQPGYLYSIGTGGAVTMPSGGNWFYYYIGFTPGGSGRTGGSGIVAGGTTVDGGGTGVNYGFAIRIN